jgi:hypothetical protein
MIIKQWYVFVWPQIPGVPFSEIECFADSESEAQEMYDKFQEEAWNKGYTYVGGFECNLVPTGLSLVEKSNYIRQNYLSGWNE